MYGKGDFTEVDDITYYRSETGDLYELDFDDKERGIRAPVDQNNSTEGPPTKKSKKDMTKKELSEDLTKKQVRENYYHETKETKLDGSAMMMETRIAKCMEAGGTFEECSKQVKAEMKKKGSDITNTEDIADEEKEEVEDEEETEEETDMEALKKEKEELLKEKEQMETDMVSMKKQFDDWGKTMEKITEERAMELSEKRQEKIKKLSKDFQLPEEDLKEESLKEILEDPSHDKVLDFIESILDKAGKRVKDEETPETTVDFTEYLNNAETEHKKLMADYDLRRSVK